MTCRQRTTGLILTVTFVGSVAAEGQGRTPDELRSKKEAQIVKLVREHFFDARMADAWAAKHAHFAKDARDEAAFAVLANRALAELKTSHTGYFDKHDPEYYALLSIFCAQCSRSRPSNWTARALISRRKTWSVSSSPAVPRRKPDSGVGTRSRVPTAARSIASIRSWGERASPSCSRSDDTSPAN